MDLEEKKKPGYPIILVVFNESLNERRVVFNGSLDERRVALPMPKCPTNKLHYTERRITLPMPKCPTNKLHYKEWRSRYDKYLIEMANSFLPLLRSPYATSFVMFDTDIWLEDFAKYVYKNSSNASRSYIFLK
jgi:hypothetical protein